MIFLFGHCFLLGFSWRQVLHYEYQTACFKITWNDFIGRSCILSERKILRVKFAILKPPNSYDYKKIISMKKASSKIKLKTRYL